ncbi:MAG TPA: prepilin peptidase [Treponemataceae bacterium]|jgi:prepilin signal peptidase PulO-like enzyme (type II secretory pathway)|nr:prepilin peptidase [Treponemataceae bacterium]
MENAVAGTLITVFFFFGLILAGMDIKAQQIPRFLSLSFLFLLLIIQTFYGVFLLLSSQSFSLTDAARIFYKPYSGALAGFCSFLFIRFAGRKKLGLADVWFSGSIGAFLGIFGWFFSILIACFFALIWIFALAILRTLRIRKEAGTAVKKDFFTTARQVKLAFIPFLVGSTLAVCVFYYISGIRL